MLILRLLQIEWSVANAKFPASTFTAHTGMDTHELAHMLDSLVRVSRRGEWNRVATKQCMREWGKCIHSPWDKLPYPYISPHTVHCQWFIGQEALHTTCSRPAALLLSAAGKHIRMQQSHQITQVPFTSLSACSDTITSLYRVLFHLSLMVLVCYWSQTYIQL